MYTVYVVEDDDIFRAWLVAILSTGPGLTVKEFESGEAFLEGMSDLAPGAVLMDLRMPGLSGIETFERYRARRADFPTVVVSGDGDIHTAVQAMRTGAVNFLVKPFSQVDLFAAINECFERLVAQMRDSDARSMHAARLEKLSQREGEVLRLMVQGYANRHIADSLEVSVRTVETFRAKLMAKLNVSNLPEAISLACDAGFVDLADVGTAFRRKSG